MREISSLATWRAKVNMDLDRLRAALSVAEADRGKWRGILDEIADVLVGKGVAYSSADFSAQIADLKAERDQLRAEVERLTLEAQGRNLMAVDAVLSTDPLPSEPVTDGKLPHPGWPQVMVSRQSGMNEPEAPLQGRAPDTPPADPEWYAAAGSIPASSAGADNAIAWQNALQGIRWALADLGLHVHEMRSVEATAEATMSAVEVLCVHLRKEGRVWTGEMLGGLTCPSQMQKEDNADLKQRVYTALGTELLYRLIRHAEVDPDLVAQFDLLGRDL
ncbi:MAG: hypothetical protein E6Q97_10735 [Desulfurellales bacterium]|nr:MAG: hypothetical protein E6Q97_10735 [Desulfurellales bacterium]